MSKQSKIFFAVIFLVVGIIIGLFLPRKSSFSITGYNEKHSGQKRLTNKLLDFDIPPSNELGDYKIQLEKYVSSANNSKKATAIAVYFRDLNNGPWVGVNGEQKFIPASLLKVPLMMVYFKKAETDPSILSKKYTIRTIENVLPEKHYAAKNSLKDGEEYSVMELIRHMIVNSDNDALFILANNVDPKEQQELYAELGFPIPENVTASQEFISPRNIGSFFRVLYNATYLNEEMSEKALQLLTETDFDKGIVAGVPKNIVVAQKYGERAESGRMELHDCGIIYFPEHPYILCVMTEGTSFENLSTIIKDISKLTYEQVKKSNK